MKSSQNTPSRRHFRVACALLSSVLLADCTAEPPAQPTSEPTRTAPVLLRATPLAADADNLQAELNINSLSLFLVPHGTTAVKYKYVNVSFSAVDVTSILNIQLVNLPLAAGSLPSMDVHVIANFAGDLSGVNTVSDINALQTAGGVIDVSKGLPMYGLVESADLNTVTAAAPLTVPLTRPCAKLRIKLHYTDYLWIGSNNRFAVENAAPYTALVPGHLPTFTAWQNYPVTAFKKVNDYDYTAIAYIWESVTAPRLRIITTMWGTETQYVVSNQFPVPERNWLYDIYVEVQRPTLVRGVPSLTIHSAKLPGGGFLTHGE